MFSLFLQSIVCTIFFVALRQFLRRRIPRGLRLPPGPPRKPILGNVLDMPLHNAWETYAKWAKEYGEIVYLDVLGRSLILINSYPLAYELFEKRSSIYSDRPVFPMVADLMGFQWGMTFHRYGEWWRRHRRVMHEKFHPKAVEAYKPIQLRHTRELLRRFLIQPESYADHLRHSAGATIMEIAYGIRVKPQNDPYIHIAVRAIGAAGEAAVPGTFLVDVFPWLKYVPEWIPGASFQRKARLWKKDIIDMAAVPFQAVKDAMVTGTAQPSFTSSHLEALAETKDAPPDEEEVIKNTAGIIFGGGADTTVNTLKILILALIMFPEVQRKAQAELDAVIGQTRLVEFEDMAALPYIVAVYKEAMRWHALLPIGVPHATTQDDIINGYFIPKGSLICGNTWTLLRDQAYFGSNTDKFNPDRYFQPGIRDPGRTGAFGYGRRICPGRFMAENSLFISVASIVQLFDISAPEDTLGNKLPLEYEWIPGAFTCPTDFKCTIEPRSKTAKELVLSIPEGV